MKTICKIGDELNIQIRQGSSYCFAGCILQSDGTPVNLTGVTIEAQMRDRLNDSAVISFSASVIPGIAGSFTLSLTEQQTASIPITDYGRDAGFVWDCKLRDSNGDVTPLYWGVVKVKKQVTR